jgi:hypothetical protein
MTAAVALLVALTPAAGAVEPCPEYDGAMTFPAIHGPEDPEDYCWEVHLYEGQELVEIDNRHAAVYYESGRLAFEIEAEAAHDAEGTTVPTTLAVSGGNIITLTVHHRTGNPAAGGAPFDYPILAGEGWEGGSQSVEIKGPPDESELRTPAAPLVEAVPASPCEVPSLRGRSLKGARRALLRAHCELGPIRGDRHRGARVVKQYRQAGKALPAGTEVGVKLG